DAFYNLGVTYAFQENSAKALEMFSKALDIQPDHLLAGHAKKLLEGNQ
ncbi:MAG: tetratricopeptide repeat protein, partial [Bacillus sp. (in: firmicutes)]